MNLKIRSLAALVEKAVARQMQANRTGTAKKRKAIREVIEALDSLIDWPGPVGRLVDLVDGPLAIWVAELVEEEYQRLRGRRG